MVYSARIIHYRYPLDMQNYHTMSYIGISLNGYWISFEYVKQSCNGLSAIVKITSIVSNRAVQSVTQDNIRR